MSETEHSVARLTARVRGDVQGVGYRFFAQRQASALGLRGYVRNLPDGSVEVVAEGERGLLQQFVNVLQRGPSAAIVEAVDTTWSNAEGAFGGFQIRH
ncbi:MAG TPA: acylphosphatase [Ktedonobacterales bacterium]